ncbi:hypothetical protein [Azonexus sp. IMCC34839]|uniref:COG4648 family protein n=1 Tax=Azonexus sp. IMCC34839 TaxID=3133695 RepID=UPI00399C0CC0
MTLSASAAQALRSLALVALLIAWAAAAHFGSAGAGSPDINAAIGVSPIVFILGLLVWRLLNPFTRLLGALAVGALLAWLWPALRQNVALLYLIQHIGSNLALGVFFGRTLLGDGEPLITRIARVAMQRPLSERKQRYTRQVTAAWTAFFFAVASTSLLLYLLAPLAVWSVFANLLTLPLLAAMFIGEHLWRMRVLPPEERPSIAQAIRAYRHATQQNSSAKAP